MKNIFVIGAGTMGLDIAQVFCTAGYPVTVYDMTDAIIEKSRTRLEKGLSKRVEKGKLTEEQKNAIMSGIIFTTNYDNAKTADLVIEAIIESVEVKKTVFRNIDSICPPETIFATNTSSISITEIAASTRPDRCIGMHFFNPATVMKLVEVIRGMETSDETFNTVYELAKDIGKTPVEVSEAPGFVVNRILIPMINEAVGLVADGVASAEDIDTAMKLGANHPMGPLALGDLIGLDVVLAIMDTLFNETKDSKYRAHPLLKKMVRANMLGRKTGKGFYQY
ncbi:MAG: 3-hydroxybutyryl-CoA dehydrogenase [Clostridia bacterium]|nr:3-hydroxybutyryl-CoA dehydrogenase [Clostridia bacterium]